MSETKLELKDIVVKAILERKGDDVRAYDCTSLTPFLDCMIVASTTNLRQNNAIAQNIKDRVKEANYPVSVRTEGNAESKWILIDLEEIVVHLFVKEERDVYSLDRLYKDVPVQVYDL